MKKTFKAVGKNLLYLCQRFKKKWGFSIYYFLITTIFNFITIIIVFMRTGNFNLLLFLTISKFLLKNSNVYKAEISFQRQKLWQGV